MENTAHEFLCGKCQEKCSSITKFLLHCIQHIEAGQPGSCPLCGMAFSRQIALREHLHRKHSIPDMKPCSSIRKQRIKDRKELIEEDISAEKIPKSKSQLLTLESPEPSDSQSFVNQHSMHVIIDKISNGTLSTPDLSGTVLHSDCSAMFPHAVPAVMMETPDHGELGQLLEQVSTVTSHPQTFQNQPDVLQSPSHTVQNQQNSLITGHSHIMQNQPQDYPSNKSDIVQTGCTVEHANTRMSPVSELLEGSGNSLVTQNHNQQRISSKSSKGMTSQDKADPDFLFVLLTSHVKHKSFNYSKQVFKCFHCHYKTAWRRALVKHMRDNHSDNIAIHQCIAVHKSNKLQDQQVMKMSDYMAVLTRQRRHVNSHRVRGVERQDLPGCYPCNKCDKVFGRLRYLRKHHVIHKVEKRFLCDDCGKAFKTKAYLAAHRQTHQTKVYRCGQCDFTSSINALIHSHRQMHNSNSVICDVCGSAYNDRTTLKKHKQVHDKSRPYPCTYPGCTWRFKTEVMCKAHFRRHTTSGRFVCHLCSYVFRHKHHLQRHLGKVHGMDEATVYQTTCNAKNLAQPKNGAVECVEDSSQLVQVVQEDHPLADTVNLIVNSGLSAEQLQSVLENGQFVIATDENDSAVNYEVANITMNVSYDSLAETSEAGPEGQTIFIPNDAECSQIIFQHESDAITTNTSPNSRYSKS